MSDTLASAILRGELPPRGALDDPAVQDRLLAAAAEQRVEGLVWRVLKERAPGDVPARISDALERHVTREAAIELVRRRELQRVVERLREAGVETLVFKGAALGYTLYPAPALRSRYDTDLLVRRSSFPTAADLLEALGYTRLNSLSGGSVHTQCTFERQIGSTWHVIDLHWAVSNRPLFASMFSFDELAAGALPVPALGPGAKMPSLPHALLVACAHRVAHHDDSPVLMWLYDIRLLVEAMPEPEAIRFAALAAEKKLLGVCAGGIQSAVALVGCPGGILRHLDARGARAGDVREPSREYLGGVRSEARSLLLDVRGSAGLRAKARLLLEHALPDAGFMRRAHGVDTAAGLAAAYLRRAAGASWRVMKGEVLR